MRLIPHLHFNGQCEEAFQFYETCLNGEITLMMTYGASPMADHAPVGWQDKILHATFTFGDQRLTGADVTPEQYEKPRGFSIALHIDNVEEAERVHARLSEHGVVQLPLQETFWALRFGMFEDQFGIPWMINCGKPA